MNLYKNDEFVELNHQLIESRAQGKAIFIEGVGLWVIGGVGETDPLKTTEIVTMTETKIGPELPDLWTAFCAVKINENSIFLGGNSYFT